MAEPPRPEQVPAGTVGAIGNLLTAVRGLTISNAVVIVILIAATIPAYFLYKVVNDQALLDRFLSNYEEVDLPHSSSCTLRAAGQRGQPLTWYVSTGFAYHGDDKWSLGVAVPRKPTMDEMQAYCETMLLVVDYMHDPNHLAPSPTFPGTKEPVIRKYKAAREDE